MDLKLNCYDEFRKGLNPRRQPSCKQFGTGVEYRDRDQGLADSRMRHENFRTRKTNSKFKH